MNPETQLIQQLFRKEFAKMVAVISYMYGLEDIEIAEDVVSETFLKANESWQQAGIPANPTAWLYAVAKQKTLYHFRRTKIYQQKVVPQLHISQETVAYPEEPDFSESSIRDNQLKMMFAVCNPAIASEAQIALALRVLCGFTIDEIAEAFLSNKETINKRLYRAKEKLREAKLELIQPPPEEISSRLASVLHIIYLLFNEGYYSTTHNLSLRQDLCGEALRLALLLTGLSETNLPQTHALIALICFHASRFRARSKGQVSVLYEDQDVALWDRELIERGSYHLDQSATGDNLSSYHLEAGIAFWHCQKADSPEKWKNILQCYDLLMAINDSPVVALNRAYAIYMVKGKAEALKEMEGLALLQNQFYFTLLSELYTGIDNEKASKALQQALVLAKSDADKTLLQTRLQDLQ